MDQEVSPFYHLLHPKYFALKWGDLSVHKAPGNVHNLYGLCLYTMLYNYC